VVRYCRLNSKFTSLQVPLSIRRNPISFSWWLRPGSRVSKVAFLDRDGVLVRDTGYPHRINDLELLPIGIAICKHLLASGWTLVITTNQSGIARGYFTPTAYSEFTREMLRRFAAKNIRFRAVLACPHHPQGRISGWQRRCLCRKPKPGMLTRAIRVLRVPRSRTMMIGDRESDMRSARQAGVPQRWKITGKSRQAWFQSSPVSGPWRGFPPRNGGRRGQAPYVIRVDAQGS